MRHHTATVDDDVYLAEDDFIINRPMTREDFFPLGQVRAQPYVHVDLPEWLHSISSFVDLPLGVVWGDHSKLTFVDPHTPYSIHTGTFNEFCASSNEHYPLGKVTCSDIQQQTCDSPHLLLDLWNRYLVLEGKGWWSTANLWFSASRMPLGIPGIPPWLNTWYLEWVQPAHLFIPSHDHRLTFDLWVDAITSWLQHRFPDPAPWEVPVRAAPGASAAQ